MWIILVKPSSSTNDRGLMSVTSMLRILCQDSVVYMMHFPSRSLSWFAVFFWNQKDSMSMCNSTIFTSTKCILTYILVLVTSCVKVSNPKSNYRQDTHTHTHTHTLSLSSSLEAYSLNYYHHCSKCKVHL